MPPKWTITSSGIVYPSTCTLIDSGVYYKGTAAPNETVVAPSVSSTSIPYYAGCFIWGVGVAGALGTFYSESGCTYSTGTPTDYTWIVGWDASHHVGFVECVNDAYAYFYVEFTLDSFTAGSATLNNLLTAYGMVTKGARDRELAAIGKNGSITLTATECA